MKTYAGAGILFLSSASDVLLARRKSGVWSIPGGGAISADQGPWETAWRETAEEFGPVPDRWSREGSMRYPFGLLGFEWTTFVLRLEAPPAIDKFPVRAGTHFHHEFDDASWFSPRRLSGRTHWLLFPLVWRLRAKLTLTKATTTPTTPQ